MARDHSSDHKVHRECDRHASHSSVSRYDRDSYHKKHIDGEIKHGSHSHRSSRDRSGPKYDSGKSRNRRGDKESPRKSRVSDSERSSHRSHKKRRKRGSTESIDSSSSSSVVDKTEEEEAGEEGEESSLHLKAMAVGVPKELMAMSLEQLQKLLEERRQKKVIHFFSSDYYK